MSTGAHALRDALILGNRQGEEKGVFQRRLSMSDEAPLRDMEKNLNPLAKKVFRTWLLCYVPCSDINKRKSESYIDHVISRDRNHIRAIMAAAVMGALKELWASDGECNLPEFDTENVGARFADCVDEPFQNQEPETYHKQVRRLLYSDFLSLRMGSTLDWDKLLSGSNLPAWSKKCLVIVERFGTEAQIDYLKTRRDQIILELIPSCTVLKSFA